MLLFNTYYHYNLIISFDYSLYLMVCRRISVQVHLLLCLCLGCGSDTMFQLAEIRHMVRIPPWLFGQTLNDAVIEELNRKLANKVCIFLFNWVDICLYFCLTFIWQHVMQATSDLLYLIISFSLCLLCLYLKCMEAAYKGRVLPGVLKYEENSLSYWIKGRCLKTRWKQISSHYTKAKKTNFRNYRFISLIYSFILLLCSSIVSNCIL